MKNHRCFFNWKYISTKNSPLHFRLEIYFLCNFSVALPTGNINLVLILCCIICWKYIFINISPLYFELYLWLCSNALFYQDGIAYIRHVLIASFQDACKTVKENMFYNPDSKLAIVINQQLSCQIITSFKSFIIYKTCNYEKNNHCHNPCFIQLK